MVDGVRSPEQLKKLQQELQSLVPERRCDGLGDLGSAAGGHAAEPQDESWEHGDPLLARKGLNSRAWLEL